MEATEVSKKSVIIQADSNESLTSDQLKQRSASIASFISERIPELGVIAVLMSNRIEYFEICLGAKQSGVYYAPISTHSKVDEIEYLIKNSDARLIFTERSIIEALGIDLQSLCGVEVVDVDTHEYSTLIASHGSAQSSMPARTYVGGDFCYSSGTTGKPKGIKHALRHVSSPVDQTGNWTAFLNFDVDSVYLSPAPLYHAAPLRFSIRCLESGGTVVVMKKFDAEKSLHYIERHKVTHSQWVPTMFIRLLNLSEEIRNSFDLSSHKIAVHAAAPCPAHIKKAMLDWWGNILWEYYTGSEKAGATVISPEEWAKKPGSVGRAVQGLIHILDESWNECMPYTEGMVYFEGGPAFEYHNDQTKTKEAHSPQGWSTFGDIGYLDSDGYLYLTDRKANMIISGGVNIYPQESENIIQMHPDVKDVAVIGIPHEDFGEEVVAVIELKDPLRESTLLEAEIINYCTARISKIKVPKRILFSKNLPRTDTGKLMKRLIRDEYKKTHNQLSD